MTHKEAIDILKRNKPVSDPRECGKELCEACDVAIDALEKQIPKRPKVKRAFELYCPTCCKYGEKERRKNLVIPCQNYCDYCGQKLDWSDWIDIE